jgi:probable DNA repair protein
MGTRAEEAEMDGWLREGGLVVTSSDRAAHALQYAFHRRRLAEGLTAWPAPDIRDWKSFVRSEWEERNIDGRLLLNSAQEQALWADIIRDEQHLPTALPASLHRLAGMAMDACNLLCSYAPRYLREAARNGWDRDAEVFGHWLTAFETVCAKQNLLSASKLPLELTATLRSQSGRRPVIQAAGFDRLLPIHRDLFDAWGSWRQSAAAENAREKRFFRVPDRQTELHACAQWCGKHIAANPLARLLVVTQQISERRGEMERAFLRITPHCTRARFEFSLGIPLTEVPLVRGANLLLRWLDGAIGENELDWFLSSGVATSPTESASIQAHIRAIRRRGLQQTHWTLQSFIRSSPGSARLPDFWIRRMLASQRQFREFSSKPHAPVAWADKVPRLLETAGWPGSQAQESADFQAHRRWQQALDTTASIGFDGRRVTWNEFLSLLERTMQETLYAPQSLDAPIQIAGPAESAGLTADAIWFLGADEDSWPSVGAMNPFLPPQIQREAGMPYSSPVRDWELADTITKRLSASAPEMIFSYAVQNEAAETLPSRVIIQSIGQPQPLPAELMPVSAKLPDARVFEDYSRVPFEGENASGGSSVLTSQSQCPFKAFAEARLGAKDWDPGEVGLTAPQRGKLLHSVLHAVWSAERGLRSLNDLRNLADVESFVQMRVQQVLAAEIPDAIREQMPARYLELEENRLVRVVTEWLAYEARRLPFTVVETESDRVIQLAGLTLKVRLDRVDRLNDDSCLVIDYKTGNVSPKLWDLPRPDDVQLPLYKIFALKGTDERMQDQEDSATGGFVFAKIRPGETGFAGYVANAAETIDPAFKTSHTLRKHRLTAAKEMEWKAAIERLAVDFIEGRAEVYPRDFPKTCERCGLQAVCRVLEPENQEQLSRKDDQEAEDE